MNVITITASGLLAVTVPIAAPWLAQDAPTASSEEAVVATTQPGAPPSTVESTAPQPPTPPAPRPVRLGSMAAFGIEPPPVPAVPAVPSALGAIARPPGLDDREDASAARHEARVMQQQIAELRAKLEQLELRAVARAPRPERIRGDAGAIIEIERRPASAGPSAKQGLGPRRAGLERLQEIVEFEASVSEIDAVEFDVSEIDIAEEASVPEIDAVEFDVSEFDVSEFDVSEFTEFDVSKIDGTEFVLELPRPDFLRRDEHRDGEDRGAGSRFFGRLRDGSSRELQTPANNGAGIRAGGDVNITNNGAAREEEIVQLLREIRDEVRGLRRDLRSLEESDAVRAAPAASSSERRMQ